MKPTVAQRREKLLKKELHGIKLVVENRIAATEWGSITFPYYFFQSATVSEASRAISQIWKHSTNWLALGTLLFPSHTYFIPCHAAGHILLPKRNLRQLGLHTLCSSLNFPMHLVTCLHQGSLHFLFLFN